MFNDANWLGAKKRSQPICLRLFFFYYTIIKGSYLKTNQITASVCFFFYFYKNDVPFRYFYRLYFIIPMEPKDDSYIFFIFFHVIFFDLTNRASCLMTHTKTVARQNVVIRQTFGKTSGCNIQPISNIYIYIISQPVFGKNAF